jgi:mRNA-degrading endonuclease YafQ of YafQ-DinJ toxin-antitoxin module
MPETARALVFTPRFQRALRRYGRRNRQRQDCVNMALKRMVADVFDPALRTHALGGNLAGNLACSCGYDCRIVFTLSRNAATHAEEIVLLDVGTHDEVY